MSMTDGIPGARPGFDAVNILDIADLRSPSAKDSFGLGVLVR